MRRLLGALAVALAPGLIVTVGIVTWSLVLTGDLPPRYALVTASLGGMASPLFWGMIGRFWPPER